MTEKTFVLLVLVVTVVILAAVAFFLMRDEGGTGPEDGPVPLDPGGGGVISETVPDPLEAVPEEAGPEDEQPLRIESIRPSVPLGSYRGRVLRENGVPVKGASVFLFETEAQAFLRSRSYTGLRTEARSGGEYVLEGIPAGRSYQIRCTSEASAFAEVECPPVEAGKIVPVADAVLSAGFALTGIVTDRDGVPLHGARLEAVNSQDLLAGMPAESTAARTGTDAAGRYLFQYLSSEQYEITAEADGFMPATKSILFGFLGSFDRELTLDFKLEKGLYAIHGRVISSAGKPLPDARIEINSLDLESHARFARKCTADGAGRFAVQGLSQGRYSVSVRANGHFQKTPSIVTPEEGEVEILLERTGGIEGTIASGARPLPGRFVVGIAEYQPHGPLARRFERDEAVFGKDGRFRLADLPPGAYTLLVKAGGFAWTTSDAIEVADGRTTRDVAIALTQGGSIAGALRDQYGRPAAGFEISLMHKHYQPGMHFGLQSRDAAEQDKTAISGDDGSFLLENIAPGEFTLQVAGTGMALKLVRNVRVDEGRETDAGIVTVTAGGTLIGTAYDRMGRPAGGTRVVAMNQESGLCKTAVTDSNGFYQMKALAPGTYTVYLESTSWSGLEFRSDTTAVVSEAATTRADLAVREARH